MRMESLEELSTEARNPASEHLDELSTLEMLSVINQEDRLVADAVAAQLPAIAAVVDAIVERLCSQADRRQGRLFYVGAGTSGRLGVLDASECPPTYNVSPELVQGVMAGGDAALRSSIEDVEDDPEQGARDLRERDLTAADCVIGIAASGRTPYVVGALEYAGEAGALTVALSCNPGCPIAACSTMAITPLVGPEVVTGSTRMKAGTATKMVLNMLSTAVMVRLGHVYGNLMVNVQLTNAKLLDRGRRIVAEAADVPPAEAAVLLETAGSVKVAIVMGRLQCNRAEAERFLEGLGGRLRETLAAHRKSWSQESSNPAR